MRYLAGLSVMTLEENLGPRPILSEASTRLRLVVVGFLLSCCLMSAILFFSFFVQVDMTVSVPPYLTIRPTHLMIMVTDKKRSDVRFKFVRLREGRCRLVFLRHSPRTYYLVAPAFAADWHPDQSGPALLAGDEYRLEHDGLTEIAVPLLQPIVSLTLRPIAPTKAQVPSHVPLLPVP